MKLLFTCVGRRVELLQEFKKGEVTIYGTDCSETAPALYFCDKYFISPLIREQNYIAFLLDLCKNEKIDLLIPTIDTDLLILAKSRNLFEEVGTRLLVSDYQVVKQCADKRLTEKLFKLSGLLTPVTVDEISGYTFDFPAFIKPLNGSSSIDAYKVDNVEDLVSYCNRISNYIIQPYIDGDEFTVDIFCDFQGNPIYITPRKRLAVRSGEVLKTQIVYDPTILEEMKKLIAVMKPVGPITVQLIKEKATNKNWYIEINPRFGGGAPLSMKAGADSSKVLIDLMLGKQNDIDLFAAKENATFCRFDQSIQIC